MSDAGRNVLLLGPPEEADEAAITQAVGVLSTTTAAVTASR